MRNWFLVILTIISIQLVAQNKMGYKPVVGPGAAMLDFDDTSLLKGHKWLFGPNFPEGNNYLFGLGSNSICDSAGTLQFLSGLSNLYDITGTIMPNGRCLKRKAEYNHNIGGICTGDNDNSSEIILPIGKDSFAVFTKDITPNNWDDWVNGDKRIQRTSLIRYIVDMKLNSGLGDVCDNQVVDSISCLRGKYTSIRHANGRDWWLIGMGFGEGNFKEVKDIPYVVSEGIGDTIWGFPNDHPAFDSTILYVYLVSGGNITKQGTFRHPQLGLKKIDTTIAVGGFPPYNIYSFGYGNYLQNIQLSPNLDGNKIAISGLHNLCYIDFDRCTGQLSNFKNLKIPEDSIAKVANTNITYKFVDNGGVFGVNFSPNGQILYVSASSGVYQYKFNIVDSSKRWFRLIRGPDTTSYNSAGTNNAKVLQLVGGVYLAPDNKIYTGTIDYAHIIHNPDLPDSASNPCSNCYVAWNIPVYPQDPTLRGRISTWPNLPNFNLGATACYPLGVDNINTPKGFNIVPNPASKNVTIIIEDGRDIKNLMLLNTSGQVIQTKLIIDKETKLDISNIPNGLYFLKVGFESQKLIIEN
jgi:hypothetical protein